MREHWKLRMEPDLGQQEQDGNGKKINFDRCNCGTDYAVGIKPYRHGHNMKDSHDIGSSYERHAKRTGNSFYLTKRIMTRVGFRLDLC